MSPSARILSISADPLVFETRNRVLQHAGFEVVPCFRGDGAEDALKQSQFDAVVLGDSLGLAHKLSLVKKVRDSNPGLAIVVVYPVGERTADVAVADAAVESLDGPEQLIRTVNSAIANKHHPSANKSRAAKAGH